jgi:hypothetical protein
VLALGIGAWVYLGKPRSIDALRGRRESQSDAGGDAASSGVRAGPHSRRPKALGAVAGLLCAVVPLAVLWFILRETTGPIDGSGLFRSADRFLRFTYQWPYLFVHGLTGLAVGVLLLPLAGGAPRSRLLAIALFAIAILLADLLLGYALLNDWLLPRMFDRLGGYLEFVLLPDRNRQDLLWPVVIAVVTAVSWWLVVRQVGIRAKGALPDTPSP